jgi:hypothetical protein
MYVPMLTYHAPQMKYWRNMKIESRSLIVDCDGDDSGTLIVEEGEVMTGWLSGVGVSRKFCTIRRYFCNG